MHREARLVFIGGVGSGGTDLLMNVLNAHRQVFIPGEIPFLPCIADDFPPRVSVEAFDDVVARMRALDQYGTLAHHHWRNYTTDSKKAVELGPPPEPVDGEIALSSIYQWLLGVPEHIAWTGNKTPTNTENIDRLVRAFPGARFVIIVRDPRDVAMSWRRRWARDERLTAAKWERRLERGRQHIAALPDGSALVIRYEELLDDLEGVSRSLCAFLELDFDPEMLRFHEHVTKTIGGQENRGRALVSGNARKWRAAMAPGLVRRIEEIAWHGMRAHGYEITLAGGPRPLTRLELAVGRSRDVIAVLRGSDRFQRSNRRRAYLGRLRLHVKQQLLHRRIVA